MKSAKPAACCPPPQSTPRRVVQPHKRALLRRLSRIEGQVRGVARMVEDDRYCIDTLTQISAIRSALDAAALQLLEDHIRGCLQNAVRQGSGEEAIAELIDVTRRFLR